MNSQILRVHNAAAQEISDAKAWYLVRSIKEAFGIAGYWAHRRFDTETP